MPAGAELIGYQIYRHTEGEPFQSIPSSLRPIKKTEYSDFGLDNSRTYHYRVRSLFNFQGQMLESLPSVEVFARPAAG